jgi:hypothetical protein
MKSKKPVKPTKQDKAWQQRVEKQVEAEKVKLDHPQGKERFDQVLKRVRSKK